MGNYAQTRDMSRRSRTKSRRRAVCGIASRGLDALAIRRSRFGRIAVFGFTQRSRLLRMTALRLGFRASCRIL